MLCLVDQVKNRFERTNIIMQVLVWESVVFLDTIRVSNSLDPDQDRHSVGPDLGPNCLQRLSADDRSCRFVHKISVLVASASREAQGNPPL